MLMLPKLSRLAAGEAGVAVSAMVLAQLVCTLLGHSWDSDNSHNILVGTFQSLMRRNHFEQEER